MAHNITPIDAFTLPITVPDNTDSGTNRAGDVENIAQTLANQTHHLNLHTAKLDQANTYPYAPQSFDAASSSTAALMFTKGAHDHPGSPQNRWKLVMQFHLSSGQAVRLFIGEGDFGDGSCFAITTNARWDPIPTGSGGQKWFKDSDLKESNILRMHLGGELHYYGRQPGGGTWNDNQWDDQQRGNASIGDTLFAKTVTCQSLNVTGSGVATNIADDVDINGSLEVTTDITVGDDIDVGDRYLYSTPKARTTQLFPEGGFNTFLDRTRLLAANMCKWRIRLPQGAIITGIKVKAQEYTNCEYEVALYKTATVNFSNTTTPASTTVFLDDYGPGLTGVVVNWNHSGLNVPVDNVNEHYWVNIFCNNASPASVDIWAVAVDWTDPGPRND